MIIFRVETNKNKLNQKSKQNGKEKSWFRWTVQITPPMGWGSVEQRWFYTVLGLLQVGKETYGDDFLYRVSDSEGEVWGLKIKKSY